MSKKYLLVDNDNTLMDFNLAESLALVEALEAAGLPHDEATVAAYHRINDAQWKALERRETTVDRLKVERFAQLLQWLHRDKPDAAALSATYEAHLGRHAELLPGAEALLRRCHEHMRIALVSNGVSAIQRGRLSCSTIVPYLDAVIISEEVGTQKPDPRMVEIALEQLGCPDRREAVFLGDSLTADIAAANAAGIESIWLSRGGENDLPTWTVHSLAEAEALLAGLAS